MPSLIITHKIKVYLSVWNLVGITIPPYACNVSKWYKLLNTQSLRLQDLTRSFDKNSYLILKLPSGICPHHQYLFCLSHKAPKGIQLLLIPTQCLKVKEPLMDGWNLIGENFKRRWSNTYPIYLTGGFSDDMRGGICRCRCHCIW